MGRYSRFYEANCKRCGQRATVRRDGNYAGLCDDCACKASYAAESAGAGVFAAPTYDDLFSAGADPLDSAGS